ncbi:MAG TPA: aminotransferase class III-fold pyridoxal phosphate-dependent enzyme [Magnetospirillum sp.]|nr:aminotransferase class III-fold pyridoxal phosphate-dependent enzyme [Magnetospirillum sp.]
MTTPRTFARSEALLQRALKRIPLGTQTFSKSKTQFPQGVSPYYVTHGKGARVWDVDGNEYIDFISSLNAVLLGYADDDVNAAVAEMLQWGSIFSLPHPIEIEVAEALAEMVPCAEMARFGKNGSDVTAGAVRLARAYTRRDYIVVCGYHGWQDWYIGTTSRNLGVPKATRELTKTFRFNDIDSLAAVFRELPDQVAAVIMEPMHAEFPREGFLAEVRELTHRHGALLVFDEMITGFRFANGGAQEYFGVIPDLATFGKGLSNGFPLSALAGRAEVMRMMEEVFFSFTFGGETLSLAAARASLDKLKAEPVAATMVTHGQAIMDGLNAAIARNGLGEVLSVSGHPSWSAIAVADHAGISQWEIKTLFLQEMFARGILTYGAHNMSYAHREPEVARLLAVYDEVLPIVADAVLNGRMAEALRCKPLVPLFTVR